VFKPGSWCRAAVEQPGRLFASIEANKAERLLWPRQVPQLRKRARGAAAPVKGRNRNGKKETLRVPRAVSPAH